MMAPCEMCKSKRWFVSDHDNGDRVVERCDECDVLASDGVAICLAIEAGLNVAPDGVVTEGEAGTIAATIAICPQCEGIGEVPFMAGSYRECETCQGNGTVPLD